MDLLNRLFGAVGQVRQSIGGGLQQLGNWGMHTLGNTGRGIMNMFPSGGWGGGGGQNNPSGQNANITIPGQNPTPMGGGQGGGGGYGGFGGMFQRHPLMTGLGLLGGAGLFGHVPPYKMPPEYNEFMQTAQAGGPQISQTGANAISNIANRPFQPLNQQELDYILGPIRRNRAIGRENRVGELKSYYGGAADIHNTDVQKILGRYDADTDTEIGNATAEYTRGIYNDYANQQIQAGQAAGQLGQQNMAQKYQAMQEAMNRTQLDYKEKVMRRQRLQELLMEMGQIGGFNALFPNVPFYSYQ